MSAPFTFPVACALWAFAALAGEPRARWELDRPAVEVGERVRATLVVEHDATVRPKLEPLAPDESWILVEQGAPSTAAEPADPGRATTRWTIELAALEPGERGLPAPALRLDGAALQVDPATLSVRGVLGEGEDAPRPLRDLPELPAEVAGARLWPWILAAALAVLAAATLAWRRLFSRAPAPAALPAPSARLAALEAKPLDSPDEVQAAHVALTRLVRESLDSRAGRDRVAMTDEEWCAAVRAELDAAGWSGEERGALARLFERAAAVKYGAERPTHWATREALGSARAFAARLEAAAPEVAA